MTVPAAAILLTTPFNRHLRATRLKNQADDTSNQASEADNAISNQTGDANTPGMYCESGGCQPGNNVITAAKSDGIFMSCETEQLSNYVNFMIGLLSAQKTLTGTMPNIDPQTGEPEYEGATKGMLDNYRTKAGVETFDEATAHCQYGPLPPKSRGDELAQGPVVHLGTGQQNITADLAADQRVG